MGAVRVGATGAIAPINFRQGPEFNKKKLEKYLAKLEEKYFNLPPSFKTYCGTPEFKNPF